MSFQPCFRWTRGWPAAAMPITQVSGYCFEDDGRILLIEDAGHFSLPGGKPEPDESFVETLNREALEEVQAIIRDVTLLGHQVVEGDPSVDGAPYAQLRAIARVDTYLPPASDPATGKMYRRVLCTPAAISQMLAWGPIGIEQVKAACHLARDLWGISFDSSDCLDF